MPETPHFARALCDRILAAMAHFEVLHGVPCQYVRLNPSDAAVLHALCQCGDVVGRPETIAGKDILEDGRVSVPSVGGTVELPA